TRKSHFFNTIQAVYLRREHCGESTVGKNGTVCAEEIWPYRPSIIPVTVRPFLREQVCEFRERERPAEIVSLIFIAPEQVEKPHLILVLDALCHHLQPQIVGQAYHCHR